jgi:hypothetical protein
VPATMLRAWVSVVLVAGVTAPAYADKSVDQKSDKASDTKSKKSAGKTDKSDSKSKSTKSNTSTSPTKTTKTKGTKGKTKKDGKGKSTSTSKARLSTQKFRGPMRMDNMPNGFSWPPTPQMIAAEKVCEDRLDLAGVPWRSVEGEGHMADAVLIIDPGSGGIKLGGVSYVNAWGGKGPYKLDCQLAVALETVGTELYAIGVREVRFGGIYSWRRIRAFGKTQNMLTRHALGLAMDVASFVDENGKVHVIKEDYAHDPFLHAIEDTVLGSKRFRTLLTPKSDPISHSDHYHFEAASDFTAKAQ